MQQEAKINMKTKINRLFGMAVLSGMAGCIALLPSVAEANGGGYTLGSEYGDILPFDMEEIGQVAMLEEDLQIDLWTSYADVKVAYRMKNTKNRPVKVRFGFPIEAEESHHSSFNTICKDPLAYRATARGKQLPVKMMVQQNPKEESSLTKVGIWMVSELEFAPGEELDLAIGCRVSHLRQCSFASFDFVESVSMVYRLSSAAVWNGPIRKGRIVVRPRSVDADGVSIKAPANRFKRDGGAWVWSFENLEPTLADDLTIAVEPDVRKSRSTVLFKDGERQPGFRNRVMQRGSVWMRGVDEQGRHKSVSSFWDKKSVTYSWQQPRRLTGFYLFSGHSVLEEESWPVSNISEWEVEVNGSWKKTVEMQTGSVQYCWVSLADCPEAVKTLKLIAGKKDQKVTPRGMWPLSVEMYEKLSREPKIDPSR